MYESTPKAHRVGLKDKLTLLQIIKLEEPVLWYRELGCDAVCDVGTPCQPVPVPVALLPTQLLLMYPGRQHKTGQGGSRCNSGFLTQLWINPDQNMGVSEEMEDSFLSLCLHYKVNKCL